MIWYSSSSRTNVEAKKLSYESPISKDLKKLHSLQNFNIHSRKADDIGRDKMQR
jgi:hypothetical protein